MELTSRLGEYGSVGAGGADCATESDMKARAMNRPEAISFFIIVWDLVLYFDLNYSEMSPERHYPNYQTTLCQLFFASFTSFAVKSLLGVFAVK
jgi:hypothetical protein